MSSSLLSSLPVHHQIINEAYSLFPTAFPPALSTKNGSSIVNSCACLWPNPQISTPSLFIYFFVRSSFFFVAAQNLWGNIKYLTRGRQLNKSWYILSLEFYSEKTE